MLFYKTYYITFFIERKLNIVTNIVPWLQIIMKI